MNIDVDVVKYIAKLSRLSFSQEEAEKFAAEFENILEHFHSLDRLDLEGVDINVFDESKKSVIRRDESTVYKDKEKLFINVKSMRETYIVVPKIIE
jgi:aspartyl-tRNA(Asn)/glutamyl-tRNA(Gln) amidotransferase subunit C